MRRLCSYVRRRRLTPSRLLVFFIILTIFLTAYLYDLIEVDTNRVVFKLHGNNEADLLNGRHIPKRFNGMMRIDYSYYNDESVMSEKSLDKLFSSIERKHSQLTAPLLDHELENINSIQAFYQEKVNANRERIFKATINHAQNEEDANDDDDENLLSNPYLLDKSESVSRDILVSILRVEKVQLIERSRANKTISIKTVVDNLVNSNELSYDELTSIWSKYFFLIDECKLTNNTKVIEDVLNILTTETIASVNERQRGTQIKMMLSLEDGTQAIVKPMRLPRDYETPPDHFYFVDFERHHAEIASFHVDKLLGFYRIPPTVGRVFNITSDLWIKSDHDFAKTFFYSPAGNVCFTGHCSYYCDTTHAICGRPVNRLEGSVQLMLPSKPIIDWNVKAHPFRRSYNKRKKAEWETNENYCQEKVFQDVTYHTKTLLDLMDMSAFDFITGNMDRHHYERLISLGNHTFPLHLDNGRAFGKTMNDELSILAPIRQCCLFRYSTYLRFKYLHENGFGRLLDESMRNDPLYPLLTEKHLRAVDRRTVLLFHELSKCIDKNSVETVLIDDGY